MSNDEFDRLLKSPAGRLLGLSERHRAAYVADRSGSPAAPGAVSDDDGEFPPFPPTVPITDDMRSSLPPRHEIELWHDTTMWNEGFDNARDAIVIVAVSTDADRDDLVAWVDVNWGSGSIGRDWGRMFVTRAHAAYPEATALTLDAAKQVFQTVIDAWGGI